MDVEFFKQLPLEDHFQYLLNNCNNLTLKQLEECVPNLADTSQGFTIAKYMPIELRKDARDVMFQFVVRGLATHP